MKSEGRKQRFLAQKVECQMKNLSTAYNLLPQSPSVRSDPNFLSCLTKGRKENIASLEFCELLLSALGPESGAKM